MSYLPVLGHILFIVLLLIGLILVPLGFPGGWLIVALSFVYSLVDDFSPGKNDFWVLFVVILLAVMGELMEFGISIVTSKKWQVSNSAIIASLVGGFVGALIGAPIAFVGSLIGLLLGAFFGAFIYEIVATRDLKISLKTSIATFFSRVTALFVKTVITLAMIIYLLIETF